MFMGSVMDKGLLALVNTTEQFFVTSNLGNGTQKIQAGAISRFGKGGLPPHSLNATPPERG